MEHTGEAHKMCLIGIVNMSLSRHNFCITYSGPNTFSMKKMIFLALGLMTIATGCNKIKQLANINVDIPYTSQVNVPAVPGDAYGVALPQGGISLPFPTVSFATNSQQYLSEYNTSSSKILDVDL